MKSINIKIVVINLILILEVLNERKVNKSKEDAEKEFCWKDTQTRGVGTVPTRCSQDQDRIGLLCYPKCPRGMTRFGFDCHSVCPYGWRNQGLFCRLPEYGRGGYPWKFGDGFNSKGMFNRCGRANGGVHNCEKKGLIVYPKCKTGFWAIGCCICRPYAPKCSQYTLNPGIDLSCGKKIIIGKPTTGICNPGYEKNVGLCYAPCKPGYTGVGPVCWGSHPTGWVNCGMGAAVDSDTCASIITNQVASVGTMFLNIATFGAGGAIGKAVGTVTKAATKIAKAAKSASKIAKAVVKSVSKGSKTVSKGSKAASTETKFQKLVKQVKEAKKFYNKHKKYIQKAQKEKKKIEKKIDKMNDIIEKVQEQGEKPGQMIEDAVRIAAEMAASIDPTGLSGIVSAYTYAECSKYFPTGNSKINNNQDSEEEEN